jgi:hypothetical protein
MKIAVSRDGWMMEEYFILDESACLAYLLCRKCSDGRHHIFTAVLGFVLTIFISNGHFIYIFSYINV